MARGIYGRVSQGMLGRADKGTVQKGSIQLLRFRIKFGMTVYQVRNDAFLSFGMTLLEQVLSFSGLVLGNWLLISVE